MTITYRSQISSPLTWAQLDENFKTVEQIRDDVYTQYKATEGFAEQTQAGIEQALSAASAAQGHAAAAEAAISTSQEAADVAGQSAVAAIAAKDAAEAAAQEAAEFSMSATYSTIGGNAGAAISINTGGSTVVRATLTADITTLAVSGTVPDGQSRQFTIILDQGVGARQVTWDANIKWADGRVPVLSYEPGAQDIISILVVGGLAQSYGFFNGGSFA